MNRRIALEDLLQNRQGLPNHQTAARGIATYSLIPATLLGILAGNFLTFRTNLDGLFLASCIFSGLISGLLALFCVIWVYRCHGFHAVARLSDALIGFFIGLPISFSVNTAYPQIGNTGSLAIIPISIFVAVKLIPKFYPILPTDAQKSSADPVNNSSGYSR